MNCGDRFCEFATPLKAGGMGFSDGCRCLDGIDFRLRQEIRKHVRADRSDLATMREKCEEMERELNESSVAHREHIGDYYLGVVKPMKSKLEAAEARCEELEKDRDELRGLLEQDEGCWMRDRCPHCGHRLREDSMSDHCPQCCVLFKAPWHYNDEADYPEDCGCERCDAARSAQSDSPIPHGTCVEDPHYMAASEDGVEIGPRREVRE